MILSPDTGAQAGNRLRSFVIKIICIGSLTNLKKLYLCNRINPALSGAGKYRDVAQLVSAPRSGRGGRKFESSHPDKRVNGHVPFALCLV